MKFFANRFFASAASYIRILAFFASRDVIYRSVIHHVYLAALLEAREVVGLSRAGFGMHPQIRFKCGDLPEDGPALHKLLKKLSNHRVLADYRPDVALRYTDVRRCVALSKKSKSSNRRRRSGQVPPVTLASQAFAPPAGRALGRV